MADSFRGLPILARVSDRPLTRRSFVAAGGAMGLLALAPPARVQALVEAVAAAAPGRRGRFLTAAELETLRALVDRLVPGPPEDPTPGAREAGVAEAIDLLLGAFKVKPPLIHAGGPFSGRAGGGRDDFAKFVALDRQAELGWRIRLEGSRGIRAREFAGPVVGLQQVYRDGLAHLDARAKSGYGVSFAQASAADRDALLADQSDSRLQTFADAALANTLEAMYGPPEYGGNRDLVGWSSNGWAGDTQPDGFTRRQVSKPDRGTLPTSPAAAARAARPLPALTGRPAPREAPWLRRGRLGRP